MPCTAQRVLNCQDCLSATCCTGEDDRQPIASTSTLPPLPPSRLRRTSCSAGNAGGLVLGVGGGAVASGVGGVPLAFCCEEPECVSADETCDGGPTCPSASFVGWDVPVDECEACHTSSIMEEDATGEGAAERRTPFDSFTECCSAACFTLPDLALGQFPREDDCPDCWATGSVGGGRSGDDDITENGSSVTTPGEREFGTLDATSKHPIGLMGMDDKAIQELFESCGCPTNHPPSFHPFHPHPFLPTSDNHIHQLSHTPSISISSTFCELLSALPAVIAFPCRWSECDLSFQTKEDLASHVNTDHLADLTLSHGDLPRPQPATEGPAGGTRCLWNDCATLDLGTYQAPAWAPNNPSSVSSTVQDATSFLLRHLLEEHLAKLEPGLALALTSSLLPRQQGYHPAGPTTLLSPFSSTPPTPSTPTSFQHPHAIDSSLPTLADSHMHSLPPSPHQHPHPHAPQDSHFHPHTQAHPYPHPHSHSHESQGSDSIGKAPCHSHLGGHRHHGHPYGVHPRVPTEALPPPQPSPTGAHPCRWRECSLSFETSAELMNHLSVEHVGSGKAGYVCEWEGCDRCDESKGFAQRQKVMRHLQTHTGDRPFACEICSKSFSEATTLTQHLRIHTNERPYKCIHEGCEKSFALASALTIHTRTHTGSKPFLCPFPGCSSAFSESSNLSKHVRTHKNERGHVCEECGKGFSRSDQLARHRKIHAKARGEV